MDDIQLNMNGGRDNRRITVDNLGNNVNRSLDMNTPNVANNGGDRTPGGRLIDRVAGMAGGAFN